MNPEFSANDRLIDRIARYPALGTLAEAIAPVVRGALDGEGAVETPIKDALHGTWLGHSLHPIVTDIPVGAWSALAVLDVLELSGRREFAPGADAALVIGLAGAVASAITGWAEWSDTKDEPQRLGMAHALLNGVAVTCYLGSFALRRGGARRTGIAGAFLGYAFTSAAAYLGGELAYSYQLGVKHTVVPLEPPAQFTDLCATDAVADGATRTLEFAGVPLLVTRRGNALSAVSAVCTHRGAPLADGTIAGDCVACPWHGSRFDLATGAVVEGPATFPLARFDVRDKNGRIEARRAFA